MPEYLAPGVFVEETSFRNKSIEGVSTTTTGFVGAARYGPIEIEPDVLTSLLDFERVFGDRRQLVWGGDAFHNYLWHGVRAFYEEGGRRLYVARVFKPLRGSDGDELTATYSPPPNRFGDDRAVLARTGLYELDGHARLWLTRETARLAAAAEEVRVLSESVGEVAQIADRAHARASAALLAVAQGTEGFEPAAAVRRSASDLVAGTETVETALETASNATILAGPLLADLSLAPVSSALASIRAEASSFLVDADAAAVPSTPAAVLEATRSVVRELARVATEAASVHDKAEAAKSVGGIPAGIQGAIDDAEAATELAETSTNNTTGSENRARRLAAGIEEVGVALPLDPGDARTKADAAVELARNLSTAFEAAVGQVRSGLEKAKAAESAAAQDAAASTDLVDKTRATAFAAKNLETSILALADRVSRLVHMSQGLATRVNAARAVFAEWSKAKGSVDAEATRFADALDAATEAKQAALNAANQAAAATQSAVTAASTAVASAKERADVVKIAATGARAAAAAAFDEDASDAVAKLETARAKAGEVAAAVREWTTAAAGASVLVRAASQATAADAGVAQVVRDEVKAMLTAVDAATTGLRENLAGVFERLEAGLDNLPVELGSAAVAKTQAAARSVRSKIHALTETIAGIVDGIRTAGVATASRLASLAGAVAPGAAPTEGVLLRARFPGAYGNLTVRFGLRVGRSLLRGAAGSLRAVGLQNGDFVWIGGTRGADDADSETGTFHVATWDADASAWRFGPDADKPNAVFWLNAVPGETARALDPAKHTLSVAVMDATILHADGNTQVWAGLAPHPSHSREGAPDSLTARFAAEPASLTDARTLPLVILADPAMTSGARIYRTLLGRADLVWARPDGLDRLEAEYRLIGGNDGQRPGAAEYGGAERERGKTGLMALEDVEDISIVAAPGSTYGMAAGYRSNAESILNALVGHAERMRYRIAVLDSGDGQNIAEVRAARARMDSKYAALYYPWVRIVDPVTRREIHLPPSGFVSGIYARNDIQRAVWKAPANEVVNLAVGFESFLNKSQQEVLNPEGINCFRFFEGRGLRLWGARTISSDPEWKYVNVRRYFNYLERSIDKATQWAVFEPNGEALWGNVRRTIEDFLFNEWQSGALLGDRPEKAFFVKCDRSTMTQNDLDNGRLVCLIGVAPLRPAEFVIFRIGQWTSDRRG